MEKLTEKSSFDELNKAWDIVNDYRERAMRAKEMKSSFMKKEELFCRECNAPGKTPALYIVCYDNINKRFLSMSFLVVEGSEGRSFVARQDSNTLDKCLTVFRSHAVSRYIERHGFNGTRAECERYLLSQSCLTSWEQDPYTKDFIEYFEDGIFLGKVKNGIYYVNTYVANQHLFTNQRLSSKKMQENMEEFLDKVKNGQYDRRIQKQGSRFGQTDELSKYAFFLRQE